jgi:hypothetical protein
MAQQGEVKFTAQSAEKVVKSAGCKIDGKKVTVPAKGIGLNALSALDYLQTYCGATVVFEHINHSNVIPANLRGKIV